MLYMVIDDYCNDVNYEDYRDGTYIISVCDHLDKAKSHATKMMHYCERCCNKRGDKFEIKELPGEDETWNEDLYLIYEEEHNYETWRHEISIREVEVNTLLYELEAE